MGASPSKEADGAIHFKADSPVRFSESLNNSLQESPDTDSTRAKNLELIIQSRVSAELEKRLKQSQDKLTSAAEAVSREHEEKSEESDTSLTTRLKEKLVGTSAEAEAERHKKNLDREKVAHEVEELRKRLDSRRKLVEMDNELEKSKESVIACLRANDRKPLNCWQEVENFKAQVGRLEKQFIEKNGS